MTRVSGQDRREERVLVQRPGPEMFYVGDADKDSAQGRAELQSHRPVRDISDGATPASDTNITEIPRVLSDRESLAAAVADPAQCFQMFLSSILGPRF